MRKNIEVLVKDKIDRLISLSLNSGVQPEELVINIYERAYKSIFVSKNDNFITVELIFEENDIEKSNKKYDVRYLYTYSLDKILLKIDCIINNQKKTEWDRVLIELKIIDEIIEILKENTLNKQLNKFIKSLPVELQRKIKIKLIA